MIRLNLILITLMAVVCSFQSCKVRKQQLAADELLSENVELSWAPNSIGNVLSFFPLNIRRLGLSRAAISDVVSVRVPRNASKRAICHISELGQLRLLVIRGPQEKLYGPSFSILKNCQSLTTVEIHDSDVSSEMIEVFQDLALEKLAIRNSRIDSTGVSAIRRLSSLRWLDLTGTELTSQETELLNSMPFLLRFDVD